MGHANLTNISKVFVDLLFEQKTITVRQVVDELVKKGTKVQASEGTYEDRPMLGYSCENVLEFLLQRHGLTARTPAHKREPVLEVVEPLTRRQKKILTQWIDKDIVDWDSGEDGEGGEYGVLDQITFKITAAWASAPKNRIPLLRYFSN